MKVRTTPFVCASLLLVGAAVGVLISSTGIVAPHSARAEFSKAGGVQDSPGSLEFLHRGSHHLARIARLMIPSVVHIQATHRTGERVVEETGSGVIVTMQGASGPFVVTNSHVVDGARANDIAVRLYDGRVFHPIRIWKDHESDIAVLKLDASGLVPAMWGDSSRVEMGHFVLAIGSPFGLSQSMTMGIISAKGRRSLKLGRQRNRVLNQDFLQTDAAINPGNSGGPLIDLNGRIIGINTAIASNSGGNDGIGFSIPSNLVRRIVEQLVTKGRVARAYLGVKLDSDFSNHTARRLKMRHVRGARIITVYSDTPAAKAGVKFDDVVIRFNAVVVQDENHLINLVSLSPIGTTVKLHVIRQGREQTVEVRLADRDELVRRSAATSRP